MKTHALKILAVSLGLCAAADNLVAQVTLTNLYSFSSTGSGATNGYNPVAGLVQGTDGNFYGTTESGGVANNYGTVFRISPGGSLTILWTFNQNLNHDGGNPKAALVQGSDGNFYGTTYLGGTNSYIFGSQSGTVFQLNANDSPITLTTLHTFTNNPDGAEPEAGLVLGSDGYFYGTTVQSGIANNYGIVFRISPSGSSYSILHSFTNSPDGGNPVAGLAQGNDGNFYGTTEQGGTNSGGTVFQLATNGSLTILHSFSLDDGSPIAGLAQGTDDNFYGTTYNSGAHSGGTVFRISPSGSYSNIYSFNSNIGDGTVPKAGLVLGSDGNFYGTTSSGGGHGSGTVFRISPSGSCSNLYLFSGGSDGKTPLAGLVQGSDGSFYGTTESGGTNGEGNVFKLIVPLNPPANQISAIQVAGTNVLVTLPSVAAEMYQLQYRTSLTAGAWANVEAQVTSIGGPLTVTNFGGFSQSQQFYRFAITP